MAQGECSTTTARVTNGQMFPLLFLDYLADINDLADKVKRGEELSDDDFEGAQIALAVVETYMSKEADDAEQS